LESPIEPVPLACHEPPLSGFLSLGDAGKSIFDEMRKNGKRPCFPKTEQARINHIP